MAAEKYAKDLAEEIHNEELEHFIKTETECCLCNSPLVSKHEVDYMTFQIHETLECAKCQITLKNSTSTLH